MTDSSPRKASRAWILVGSIALVFVLLSWLVAFTPIGRGFLYNVLGAVFGSVWFLAISIAVSFLGRKDPVATKNQRRFAIAGILSAAGLVAFLTLTRSGLLFSTGSTAVGLVLLRVVAGPIYRRFPRVKNLVKESDDRFLKSILCFLDQIRDLIMPQISLGRVALFIIVVMLPFAIVELWPVPELLVEPRQLAFGSQHDSLEVILRSSREDAKIEWEIVSPEDLPSWIMLSRERGTTSAEDNSITVTIARHELVCKEYAEKIWFKYGRWLNKRKRISLDVDNTPDSQFPQKVIVFEPRSGPQYLAVANRGANSSSFVYLGLSGKDCDILRPHITVSPSRVDCGPGESRPWRIEIDWQSLPHREEQYEAEFCYAHGCPDSRVDDTRELRVEYPPPSIQVDPEILPIPPGEIEVSVTLRNSGRVPAVWECQQELPAWIAISPSSGNLGVGKHVEVLISVDRCVFPVDGGRQELRFFLRDGGKEEILSLDVKPAYPALAVEPSDELFIERDIGSIRVANGGCGTLKWDHRWEDVAPQDDQNRDGTPDWVVSVDPKSGTIESGQDPYLVNITITRVGLAQGTRRATLCLVPEEVPLVPEEVRGEPQTVEVWFDVEPELEVSTTQLDFSWFRQRMTFEIVNSGSGTLSWKVIDPGKDWFSVAPLKGSCFSGDPSTIAVDIDRSFLVGEQEAAALTVVPTEGGREESVDVLAKSWEYWDLEVCLQWREVLAGIPASGPSVGFSLRWPWFDIGVTFLGGETQGGSFSEMHAYLGRRLDSVRLAVGLGGISRSEVCGDGEKRTKSVEITALADWEICLASDSKGCIVLGLSVGLGYSPRKGDCRLVTAVGLRAIRRQ